MSGARFARTFVRGGQDSFYLSPLPEQCTTTVQLSVKYVPVARKTGKWKMVSAYVLLSAVSGKKLSARSLTGGTKTLLLVFFSKLYCCYFSVNCDY